MSVMLLPLVLIILCRFRFEYQDQADDHPEMSDNEQDDETRTADQLFMDESPLTGVDAMLFSLRPIPTLTAVPMQAQETTDAGAGNHHIGGEAGTGS